MTYCAKHHDSCVRVLEFLKLLIQDDIDIKELDYEKKFKNIEAPETFLKYISTLEASGFDVRKIGKKYSLIKYPEEIELSDFEINLLSDIYKAFNFCCMESQKHILDEILIKIQKMLPEETKRKILAKLENIEISELAKQSSNIATQFQKYVDLSQKLKVTYNGEVMTVIPKRVEIQSNNVFLIAYNPQKAENFKFLTQKIEEIEILPIRAVSLNMTTAVVFAVYGRLIVNYRLRDCERIQSFTDEEKIIINTGEDKKSLIKRLMKYGENCKILSPKFLQKEMLDEIEKIENRLKGVKK